MSAISMFETMIRYMTAGACLMTPFYLTAATTAPGSTAPKITPVPYPPQQAPTPTPPPMPLPPKPTLPLMEKPFGMPGVIGFRDGKWQGTDYLGHLAKHISVEVEILKGDHTPLNVDTGSLQSFVSDLFRAEGLVPHADVKEGPPLPFLHVLVIIYPADKNSFVIFATSRLFEEIEVLRKDFRAAGHWQGITWENQDISVATETQIPSQVKTSVETIVKAFLARYRLYNPESIDKPTQ